MKYRRILLFLFLCLTAFGKLHAQLLWRVTGSGLKDTSFLFGTHHLIDPEKIPGFDRVTGLCAHTEVMIGEMDLAEPGMQAKMTKASLMKERHFDELLSPEEYKLVDKEFKALTGMGLNMLGAYKPMMLVSLYQLMTYMKVTGADKQAEGVDVLLQKEARSRGKKVLGLESADLQLHLLFDAIPLKRQAEILVSTVQDKDRSLQEMKQLDSIYLSGDLDRMAALEEEDGMTPDEKRLLVDDRNEAWIKILTERMKDQSCLVAVGCMHLAGVKGLIAQLRASGFCVEPVNDLKAGL